MADSRERPNPYLGPRPFERTDTALFFGRAAEMRELLSLVVASQVVLVYAASGAGKTSLLNAGLTPLLEREEHFEVLPASRFAGGLDERMLAKAGNVYGLGCLTAWGMDPAKLIRNGREQTLAEFLEGRPHQRGPDGMPAPRAILFDQFEELFTLYPQYWPHQQGFLEQIAEALDLDPLLRVVLAIREDHVAQLEPFADLLPRGLEIRYRLEQLGREQALEAVKRPAELVERAYADGVAERLVSDLMMLRVDTGRGAAVTVQGPFVEPVQLQVTCHRLWADVPPETSEITDAHVRTYGDVDQVLATFYDNAVEEAASAGPVDEGRLRGRIEDVFITSVGTRGTVYRSEQTTAGVSNAAIDALENRHLIRAEWRAGARWYELTHDRLIGPVRESNERFRANARRRRRRAISGAVGGLVLVLAGLALVLIVTGALDRDGSQASLEVELSQPELKYNVSFGLYLVSTGITIENATEAKLRERGNQVTADVTTRGISDGELTLEATTLRARERRRADDDSSQRVSVTPTGDLQTITPQMWVPLPRAPGRYLYRLRILSEGETLASARSEEFRVDADRRAAPITRPLSVPITPLELVVRVIGDGRVLISPPGTSCPPLCSVKFEPGTEVALLATPGLQSTFGGWVGPCGGGAVCVLKLTTTTAVAAAFVDAPPRQP